MAQTDISLFFTAMTTVYNFADEFKSILSKLNRS